MKEPTSQDGEQPSESLQLRAEETPKQRQRIRAGINSASANDRGPIRARPIRDRSIKETNRSFNVG